MAKCNIFWFRRDLRLVDNTGLYHALSGPFPVVPVFIFDTNILDRLPELHDQRVRFIAEALRSTQKTLTQYGGTLDVRYGGPQAVFETLTTDYDVHAVYTNHDYEPYARGRDAAICRQLEQKGIAFYSFKDQVIFEKDEILKKDGRPYTVFTPYSKQWRARLQAASLQISAIEPLLTKISQQQERPFPSLPFVDFAEPTPVPLPTHLPHQVIRDYDRTRNFPFLAGTSRLGVHLRFGTISIRELVLEATKMNSTFLNELIWREFFMHILWHFPYVQDRPFKKGYDHIRWRNNEAEFERWCKGNTGVPIVDAGMRELNATGFMHNRVRMIVASYLVKHLLIDWRWGEAYFADKLLDYELASNNGNWQWIAGCGCDAAPYFRVFNPETQAKKFDPRHEYISKWVPEWQSASYARPLVEHTIARERFMAVYRERL